MISAMYFTVTTRMSAHTISESTPYTTSGVTGSPYSGLNASRKA